MDVAKMLAMMGKGKKKPVEEVEVDEKPEDDEGDVGAEGKTAAMSDFIHAVKLGDVDGAVEAWDQLNEF